MKAWALIVSLAVASPAYAIPPVLPPGTQEFVQAFIRANRSNNVAAYAELFSPDAKIIAGTDAAVGKADWIKTVSAEFVPNRQIRYLDIFAGGRAPVSNIVFVEAVNVCFPYRVECFATYRTETLAVKNGQIMDLTRSEGLSRRFTSDGAYGPLE